VAVLSTYDADDATSHDADGSNALLDATNASSNENAAPDNRAVS